MTDLDFARALIALGMPVFAAPPCGRCKGDGCPREERTKPGERSCTGGFWLPGGWEKITADPVRLDVWRDGWALCGLCGVVFDVVDTDPQNDGERGRAGLSLPSVYAVVQTPSGGTHEYVAATGVAKGPIAPGVDYQAGEFTGAGRGFVFLPPTRKTSKTTGLTGVPYVVTREDLPLDAPGVDATWQATVRGIRDAAGRERREMRRREANGGLGSGLGSGSAGAGGTGAGGSCEVPVGKSASWMSVVGEIGTPIPMGQHDNTLTSWAAALRAHGATWDEGCRLLRLRAEKDCVPPWAGPDDPALKFGTAWQNISAPCDCESPFCTTVDGKRRLHTARSEQAQAEASRQADAEWRAARNKRLDARSGSGVGAGLGSVGVETWESVGAGLEPVGGSGSDGERKVYFCDEQGRVAEDEEINELFDRTPELRWARWLARATQADPLAVLAQMLCRVAAGIPPFVTLPAIIGGEVSSGNINACFVGESGDGKGLAAGAVRANFHLTADLTCQDKLAAPGTPARRRAHETGLGTGHGVIAAFVSREDEKDGGQIRRDLWSVLFDISEVDTLSAHAKQSGSTVMAVIRQIYMGERIGDAYKDPKKNLHIEEHGYRAVLMVSGQPTKFGPLIEDNVGGTPQRFMWFPVDDQEFGPDNDIDKPEPLVLDLSKPGIWLQPDVFKGTAPIKICKEAEEAIRKARRERRDARRAGKEPGVDLDGHALLTREKWAYVVAVLHGRFTEITVEDWEIAGLIQEHSNRTRAEVQKAVATAARTEGIGRAKTAGEREAVAEEAKTEAKIKSVAATLSTTLRREGCDMAWSDLRRKVRAQNRKFADEALDRAVSVGEIKVEDATFNGQGGRRCRCGR